MVRLRVWLMARAYLVRHGKSAAGFDAAFDSPLSDLGFEQARIAANGLAQRLDRLPILSSPMLRAIQTAEPLAGLWDMPISVETAVTEIPVPEYLDDDLKGRRPWLDDILKSSYGTLDRRIEDWRRTLLAFMSGVQSDCVIFTHYLTINAIVGAAIGNAQTVVFDPGYCSVVEVDAARHGLRLADSVQLA